MAAIDELTEFLQHFKLDAYDAALRDAGAEALGDLKELEVDDITELATEAAMKTLHKKKFLKACASLKDGSYPPPPPQPKIDYGPQIDAFLTQYKLIKYSQALQSNGLSQLEIIQSMNDEQINAMAANSKLGVLHKKKFLAACNDYKNGAYIAMIPTTSASPPAYSASASPQGEVIVASPAQPQVVVAAAQPVQPQVVVAAQPQVVVAQPQVVAAQPQAQVVVAANVQTGPQPVTVTSIVGPNASKQLNSIGKTFGRWGRKAKKKMEEQVALEKERQKARDAQARARAAQNQADALARQKAANDQAAVIAAQISAQPQVHVVSPQPAVVSYAQPQVVVQEPVVSASIGMPGIGMSIGGGGMGMHVNMGQPQVVMAQPAVHVVAQPTSSVSTVKTNEDCPKCVGTGFTHESNMTHDKPKGTRCFFCKDCNSCNGNGFLESAQVVTTTTDVFGHMHVSSSGGIQTCPKCKGKGWMHKSNMTHDKGDGRCFFCKDCDYCAGKGRTN